jgi:hypothetical protein
MQCIVKYCKNHSSQGRFIGDLCAPCHEYVTLGRGIHSQAFRNTQAEVLKEREACAKVCDDLSDRDYGPYNLEAEERDSDASMQCAQMIRLRNGK